MKNIIRLWWNDYKETWEFAKKHPLAFIGFMIAIFLILKLIGL